MRLAISVPHSIDVGSIPRSKRYRASEVIPSLRPVVAIWIGSKRATSRNTLVVFSLQPDAKPPMTPPIPCGPSSSEIMTIPSSSTYSFSSRASNFSPNLANRMMRSPLTLSASNTCNGRPRSNVDQLVISTNAEIGRKPIERRRSWSHFGLSPLVTLRNARPTTTGQASPRSFGK